MKISDKDLRSMDRIRRLNIVNSITGVKPANLVGTRSADGVDNLAIFSSAVHLGSDPALLGLISRPKGEVRRHTYENIADTRFYSINCVTTGIVARAHMTSAKFNAEESEFEECGIEKEELEGFPAPFVKDSPIRIGLELAEIVPIERNGTILIIGEIRLLKIDPELVSAEGYIDLEDAGAAGISGLNNYYGLKKVAQLPYARPEPVHELLKVGDQ